MPLTVDDFLGCEPTVIALERQYAGASFPMRRKLGHDVTALRKMLISRWEQGVAGWLTRDEAQVLADQLDQIAADRGLTAWALVEDRSDGESERPYLVLAGGSCGEHVLDLRACNPVRARAHWLVYLEQCPCDVRGGDSDGDGGSARWRGAVWSNAAESVGRGAR